MSTYLPTRRDPLAELLEFARSRSRWMPHLAVAGVSLGLAAALLPPRVGTRSSDMTLLCDGAAAGAVLKVTAASAERRHGFVTVTGDVENLSSRSLSNTEAVVEFYDGGGRFIKSESAVLELSRLRPQSDSPFAVVSREAPGMTSYRVRFRALGGAAIPFRTE